MAGGDYNTRGRYHEVLFKAEYLKRDLIVLSPEQTHLPFDVAIWTGSRFITVQIKGTGQLKKHKRSHHSTQLQAQTKVNFAAAGSGSRATYLSCGVDFFAAYVGPMMTWYIIPTICVTGKTFEIRFSPEAKANDWRERWDFLGAKLEIEE